MIKSVLLRLIRLYQRTTFFHGYIARTLFLTDAVCRFKPSCSEYMYQAILQFGVPKGFFLGIKRILRCHPWSKGGYDPIPKS